MLRPRSGAHFCGHVIKLWFSIPGEIESNRGGSKAENAFDLKPSGLFLMSAHARVAISVSRAYAEREKEAPFID